LVNFSEELFSMGGQGSVSVNDEFSRLERVIIGLGAPYLRDRKRVAGEMAEFPQVPNTERRQEVLALSYPSEAILLEEYRAYVATLEKYGVEVLRADPLAAYSFDYTCPRDIGFVIGDHFFVANMAVASRAQEILTIESHLQGIDAASKIRLPGDCLLEGGDVILLDARRVLVGQNLRSNRRGCEFLQEFLEPLGYTVIPVPHVQLHLDCCLNPLGQGHLLIHPESLVDGGEDYWPVLEQFDWIRIDGVEREHLATNVLSIDPRTIIARNHAACARVNRRLSDLGYRVEAIGFDGVPATGGSFRCASLALQRAGSGLAGDDRIVG
jgi:N-dimethylarginine dimethylaminohydrolase